MAIQRIEKLVYGVEDIDLCSRFFSDVGLQPVEAGASFASFRTPVNQFVELRPIDDPSLPAPVVEGSNLRELVWGVDTRESITAIAADLSGDRDVTEDGSGVLHTTDLTGHGIAFTVADIEPITVEQRRYNVAGSVERRSEDVVPHERSRPMRLIHVALDIPREGREEAMAFYIERLNFKPIDTLKKMGTFMQCEGDIEHHNFLLCHRTDRPGLNHVAMEVRDIDEVVEGGNFMVSKGWKESRRFGRHRLGSNVFRFFHAPCGGRIELATDMDRMDKSFESRYWDESPPHHLWILKSASNAEPGNG